MEGLQTAGPDFLATLGATSPRPRWWQLDACVEALVRGVCSVCLCPRLPTFLVLQVHHSDLHLSSTFT